MPHAQPTLVHPIREVGVARHRTARHVRSGDCDDCRLGGPGPLFGFSDTWQLVINTGTTIVTFLMVFLIQNTQNRDTGAMQVKLDELIRAIEGAHNALLDLEELEEDDLDRVRADYLKLATEAREALRDADDSDSVERLSSEEK
jgi:low affinity Fe/Cu permease